MSQRVYPLTMFDGASGGSYDGVLTAGESKTSRAIEINSIIPLGNWASQLIVAGDGTVTVELLLSLDGTNFVVYDTLYSAKTSVNAGAPGVMENHVFAVCTKFKIRITETSTTDGATVSHYVGVQ